MSKKILLGKVISDKMDKTRTVLVERTVMHPIYKKFYKTHKKYMVHDEESLSKMGDRIRIVESRPLSKKKRWKFLSIVESSKSLLASTEGGKG